MRFTLKDYQDKAARDVLSTLARCRRQWHEDGERYSFALTSPTGSGKTVVAATVVEALIHGSDEFDIDPDPGAVVLWISHDPNLNKQTKHRFIEAADRIPTGDLVLLDSEFAEDRLLPGTVYFINPDKLRSGGLFVRRTDKRSITFWEILDNTVKDEALTLYVVLDEAHEGMRKPSRRDAAENQTIVLKIINGNGTNAPVPIVFGISATVARFDQAMAAATNRGRKPNVRIDPKDVQASGLIKSTVHADIPDERGDFVTTFVRRAATDFTGLSARWEEYCLAQNIEVVLPLLVIQIPNKAEGSKDYADEDGLIYTCIEIVRKEWPDFTDECVAHVLGDRAMIEVGHYKIPKVQPEDLQVDPQIRVLIAKDAVSTGWDCPRAEVLVSLRPATDHTYITQLLGRMVRTPLARSTEVARLNSASCYLPLFDPSTAQQVVEEITGQREPGGGDGGGAGPKVLFKPVDLIWNPTVPLEAKALIESLPSFPKPAADPKPIKRLLAATPIFAQDGLIPNANDVAHDHLIGVLAGISARYAAEIAASAQEIKTADIRRLTASYGSAGVLQVTSQDVADINTVDEALRATRRSLSASLVNRYWKREWEAAVLKDPFGADMMDVKARVAALAYIETPENEKTVVQAVEDAADALLKTWLSTHHDDIKLLPEGRRAAYDEIRAKARDLEQVDTEIRTDDRVESVDAERTPLPTAEKHILSGADGRWPMDAKLNRWERAVIGRETARDSVVAWYRNPSTAGKDALRIAYRHVDGWKSLQPDFVFVERDGSGALRPSIVDPHGWHLADAMPKLLALADYAEQHGGTYARVDALAADKPNDPLRRLDLTSASVRAAIRAAADSGGSVQSLFSGQHSMSY